MGWLGVEDFCYPGVWDSVAAVWLPLYCPAWEQFTEEVKPPMARVGPLTHCNVTLVQSSSRRQTQFS